MRRIAGGSNRGSRIGARRQLLCVVFRPMGSPYGKVGLVVSRGAATIERPDIDAERKTLAAHRSLMGVWLRSARCRQRCPERAAAAPRDLPGRRSDRCTMQPAAAAHPRMSRANFLGRERRWGRIRVSIPLAVDGVQLRAIGHRLLFVVVRRTVEHVGNLNATDRSHCCRSSLACPGERVSPSPGGTAAGGDRCRRSTRRRIRGTAVARHVVQHPV